tara:strand:+ start:1510 stop:2745 length:1236 start_codon:yes stop_codon:yes gene_type:complete
VDCTYLCGVIIKPFIRAYSFLISILVAAIIVSCGGGEVGTTVETADSLRPTSPQKNPIEKPINTVVASTKTPTPKPERSSTKSKSISKTSDEAIQQNVELRISEIATNLPKYDRDEWKHWIDEDKDCQNARHEVLVSESLVSVGFKNSKNCQVASGEWFDPYTGETLTDATKLDVDHMVPLKNAHDSGGWAWDKERKSNYANYLQYEDHLIAVTASANRKKGAKAPDEWRPTNENYWCDYATNWIAIKVEWGLSATKSEWKALEEMLSDCEQDFYVIPVEYQGKKPPSSSIPKTGVSPSVPKSTSGYPQGVQLSLMDCKGKPEKIVIYNKSAANVDMTGWTVSDDGRKHTFNFPSGFILYSDLSVEIVSGRTGQDTSSTIYWKKQTVWNNDGDTATLFDSDGKSISEMDCP